MDKLTLLDSLLYKLPDNEIFGNLEYKSELEELYNNRSTEQEGATVELMINFIDNNKEQCHKITEIIYSKKSDKLDDIDFAIYTIIYYFSLGRALKNRGSKLSELNINKFIAPISYLSNRLNHEDSPIKKLRWIPSLFEGLIYAGIDFQKSVNKCSEAISIGKEIEYSEYPLSMAYAIIADDYYEEGYFHKVIQYYKEAKEKWPDSKIINNNLAFVYSVLNFPEAFDALVSYYNLANSSDPLAGYNLASFILSKSEDDKGFDLLKLLTTAYDGFLDNYNNTKSKRYLLEAFSSVVLEDIAHYKIPKFKRTKKKLTITELEEKAARDLLQNLFGDVENFISTTYEINEKLNNFLDDKKTITNENTFVVLKRWSSYTPLIPRAKSTYKGGGFFFTWLNKGIIVDPGPSFLENFLESGFRLSDIDAIICSHGHIDHSQDIERIITLLFEKNDTSENKQKIKLILSPGSASKYGSLLSASAEVIDSTIVLYPDKTINIDDLSLRIHPIKANHFEIFAKADTALSFIIELKDKGTIKYTLGFTNDTGFKDKKNNDIIKAFNSYSFDLLITNIGSISFARLQNLSKISMEKTWFKNLKSNVELTDIFDDPVLIDSLGYKKAKDIELTFFKGKPSTNYEWYSTHLGFRGVLRFAAEKNYKYMIISEFGEELKNYRHLIAKSLNQTLNLENKVITGDIGTKFLLVDGKVLPYCQVQDKFIDKSIIEKVVKNEDFRIIHIAKEVMEVKELRNRLDDMFGIAL